MSNYRVIAFFMRPYRSRFLAVFVVMVMASILEGLSLAAFFPLLSSLASGEAMTGGGTLRAGFLRILGWMPSSDPVVAAAILLVLLFVVKAVLSQVRDWMVAHTTGRVLYDLKDRSVGTYGRRPYQFFLDNKEGHLLYQALTAPGRISLLLQKVITMAAEVCRVVAIAIVLLTVFPLGMAALVVLGLVYYQIIRILSRRISYHVGRERYVAASDELVIVTEFISGIRQIMTFCAERHWEQRFREKNASYSHLYARDLVWLGLPKHLMEPAAMLLMLGCLVVLRLDQSTDLTVLLPQLGIFAAGVVQMLPAVTTVGRSRMEIQGLMADAEKVHEALIAGAPTEAAPQRQVGPLADAVRLENVTFSHAGRPTLLHGINLTIKRGEVTALVGTSGAGKSTIVNLLLGLFQPSGGSVTIDGHPLTSLDIQSWRRRLGLVTQDPFVFHGTVAENILFGRSGFSPADVEQAATAANAHDFIKTLPEGYNTVVGERGMKLSGGQQQRLCIARALLGDPDILIFDEATSSLDIVSETAIQNTIANLARNYTVIVIAHRVSSVSTADNIVVLHQGRVVEQGRHEELVRANGQYAVLFATPGQRAQADQQGGS